MSTVVWLEDVRRKDIPLVGGKGASLGEMIGAGLPVPGGFAVTADAFRRFITETGIADQIFKALEIDVDNNEQLKSAEKQAKKLIMDAAIPAKMKKEIIETYKKLNEREGSEIFVAIRSSATAEDLPDASFAGQQETYLNVRGAEEVVEAVKKCWASLYGARAIFYRMKQGFDHRSVNISVVVQKMVNAEKAGVMFTSHPSTGEPQSVIEASWGLGETVVSGSVSPDNYVVDRKARKIVQKMISTKLVMKIKDPRTGKTVEVEVPKEKKEAQVLTDDEILAISKIGDLIEEHYGYPQDVEWALEGGKIFMLQSRPVTTIKRVEKAEAKAAGEAFITGLGASPGLAFGKVKIIRSADELDKVQQGDILVTTMTSPDMVPAMKRAAAIVTDEGGLTCHAAIVSRELGTPCIVGTKTATKTLKDSEVITVDGEKGHVYKGVLEKAKAEEKKVEAVAVAKPKPITVTEIKVNISIPEAAQKAAATGADGVGLLRIEHMILGLNKHPGWYIKRGRSDEYINELVQGIKTVADAFYPKPVWVRTLDAPTDEFRAMEGGQDEPHEPNPMLGYRGIRRDITEVEHYKLQLKALKKVFEMGYTNVGVMLPMVQHPRELRRAKEIMREVGIDMDRMDIGIMVEIPAAAVIIDEFLKEGLDFISFGTNDLTQYTLAVDRNNENVAHIFDEFHPAVLRLIEHVIKECNKAGVQTSICGQAGSDPKFAEQLVKLGITSISSNIDAVERVREMVARTEQKILLDAARSSFSK